jgi:hypothetical protein
MARYSNKERKNSFTPPYRCIETFQYNIPALYIAIALIHQLAASCYTTDRFFGVGGGGGLAFVVHIYIIPPSIC